MLLGQLCLFTCLLTLKSVRLCLLLLLERHQLLRTISRDQLLLRSRRGLLRFFVHLELSAALALGLFVLFLNCLLLCLLLRNVLNVSGLSLGWRTMAVLDRPRPNGVRPFAAPAEDWRS